MKLENNLNQLKTHKHMEVKYHVTKQWMGYNETKEEIRRYLETNENKNTTPRNLWDTVKAVLTWILIALQAYLRKQGKPQTNNLILTQRD